METIEIASFNTDEGNWRNDYPDEQEDSSCNLSDEEDALRYQPYSGELCIISIVCANLFFCVL